jgi:hypothetical protein
MARIENISGKEEVMGGDINTVVLLVIAVELALVYFKLPRK